MTEHLVAILSFHKIGVPPPPPAGWDSWFYVSEQSFGRFLGELRDEGWELLDLAHFLRGLEDPGTLPTRSALLTFDDGYRSTRDTTLPWLRRFGASGVLFVPTDHVGGYNAFDRGVEPEEPICSWDDLRFLQDSGLAIQSHATSHRSFSTLDDDERARELARSKAVLEEQLGEPVDTIAFPYGDPGPDSAHGQAAAAGYRAAFLYRGSPVRMPVGDPYRIERIAMGANTDLLAELRVAS
jgi:peptidoglycan/xylan/chitin deacetylase (PgdA/CDA1 family)